MANQSLIHVVGMGITGADSLLPKHLALVEAATVLVGGQRHLQTFDYLLTPSSQIEGWPLGDFHQTFAKMRSHARSHPNARIVVLTSGDPLFFGLGRLLLAHFPAEQLAFHPHISAIQLAFSRIKLPWQDATLLSVHGRSEAQLIQAVKRGDRKIALLTDNVMTPQAIADLLVSLEASSSYQLWVCENLGAADERVAPYSLKTVQEHCFAPLNVVVLHRPQAEDTLERPENLPLVGLPDTAFYRFPDRPALMTKKEIRLLILGELAPLEGDVIWDIGAGTGSISIELSRLRPQARLYAIEKTAIGFALIKKNAKRLAPGSISVIQGSAPKALENLPLPNRVFIGGSGGQLSSILTLLSEIQQHKSTNKPQNHLIKVVIALATAEHLSEAIAWVTQTHIASHWAYHLTQINVSRSVPVGALTRLQPLNPVTLMTLQSLSLSTS